MDEGSDDEFEGRKAEDSSWFIKAAHFAVTFTPDRNVLSYSPSWKEEAEKTQVAAVAELLATQFRQFVQKVGWQ